MDDFTDLDISIDNDPEEDEYHRFASESFLDNLERDSDGEDIPHILDEQGETVDQQAQGEEISEWSIPLSNVPKALRISEFGHTYIYGRLKDPDGSPTNKFHGFFKNNLNENSIWKSLPGVLSDRYAVVSLEKFINNVLKQKFENIVEYSVCSNEPWKLSWLGIDNSQEYDINYLDRDSTSIIFENNFSGSISSKLGYIITNTYNGANKLKMTPIVKTVGVEGENELVFIDLFTFCNFTQVISHSSKCSNIDNDLMTIKENVGEHMSILKGFTDTNSIIRNISKCFRKSGKNTFKRVLDGLSEKNLFNVLLAISMSFGEKYSIIEYLSIRSKVVSILEQIF